MINSITFNCGVNSIDVLNDEYIRLVDISGISAIGVINTASVNGYDGASFISSQMPMRNINISLRFMGGDVEANKLRLYKTFRVKSTGNLYYKSEHSNAKIECIVEKIDIPPNIYPLRAQISLLCPFPYFTDLEPTRKIMSAIRPLWRFPHHFNGTFKFSERMTSVIENFVNDSTVDVYPIIELRAVTAVTNPSITNINTYEKMKVNISLAAGEKLVIDTNLGKKTITKISGSNETNVFNLMADDFKFFKLYVDDNYLKYDADTNSGGLMTTVSWQNLYGGV